MPLDHHGREIADVIPYCVKNQISGIDTYLESRLMTTEHLERVCKVPNKCLKDGNLLDSLSGDNDMFTETTDLWVNDDDLIAKIYDDKTTNKSTKVQVFDVPHLHNPRRVEAQAMHKALLSHSENMEIFNLKSV